MNGQRLDKLLGWLSTGATAIALGGFLIVWGWLFPLLSEQSARYKSTPVDPQTALVGGLLLIIVGLLFVTRAGYGHILPPAHIKCSGPSHLSLCSPHSSRGPISATPHTPGVDRAVGYCSVVYIGGALLLCFGDFQYGLFPLKSLRPIFIIGGGALMILAVALVYSLQRKLS